jgi:hypothetical protein
MQAGNDIGSLQRCSEKWCRQKCREMRNGGVRKCIRMLQKIPAGNR